MKYEIKEMPDIRGKVWEYPELYNEPLMEYVCCVADEFKPGFSCDDNGVPCILDYSDAPAVFYNRYFDAILSNEERYLRYKEIYPNRPEVSFENFCKIKSKYPPLDLRFKDRYLDDNFSKDIMNTLELLGLDKDKFWYLLLFVWDLVKDATMRSPQINKTILQRLARLKKDLYEADSIEMRVNERIITYDDEFELSVLRDTMLLYEETFVRIVRSKKLSKDQKKKKLCGIGFNNKRIATMTSERIDQDNVVELGKCFRLTYFYKIMRYFLEKYESKDKPFNNKPHFISHLAFVITNDPDYDRHYNDSGNRYRKLSNTVKKYKKYPFHELLGGIYNELNMRNF